MAALLASQRCRVFSIRVKLKTKVIKKEKTINGGDGGKKLSSGRKDKGRKGGRRRYKK